MAYSLYFLPFQLFAAGKVQGDWGASPTSIWSSCHEDTACPTYQVLFSLVLL